MGDTKSSARSTQAEARAKRLAAARERNRRKRTTSKPRVSSHGYSPSEKRRVAAELRTYGYPDDYADPLIIKAAGGMSEFRRRPFTAEDWARQMVYFDPSDPSSTSIKHIEGPPRPPAAKDRARAGNRKQTDKPTQLYRHFSETGVLLYVGVSLSAVHRLSQHRTQSTWTDEIAEVKIEWFGSRKKALAAEKRAIRMENPRHNVVHSKCVQTVTTPPTTPARKTAERTA